MIGHTMKDANINHMPNRHLKSPLYSMSGLFLPPSLHASLIRKGNQLYNRRQQYFKKRLNENIGIGVIKGNSGDDNSNIENIASHKVRIEPMYCGLMSLHQAHMLTSIPKNILENMAANIPGAVMERDGLKFDTEKLARWVESFRTQKRTTVPESLGMTYTISEAAAHLRVNVSTIRRMIMRGELSGFRMCRGVRIYHQSIEDYKAGRIIIPSKERKILTNKKISKSSKQHTSAVNFVLEALK